MPPDLEIPYHVLRSWQGVTIPLPTRVDVPPDTFTVPCELAFDALRRQKPGAADSVESCYRAFRRHTGMMRFNAVLCQLNRAA